MAQILVKKPRTYNGRDVMLDDKGRIIYKETILNANARRVLEKINASKPQALKMIIEDYNPAAADKPKKDAKTAV
jgi:hypothetical protein